MSDQTPTPEASAELLRMTVPLMTRHSIPTTPHNYAVWYTYVSGNRPELNEAIDRLIANKTRFSEQINLELFQNFASECDLALFKKIRSEMADILSDVGGSLADVGNSAENFGGTLDGLVENVERSNNLDDIRTLLTTLVEETRGMQRSTRMLHEHLESKSREISLLQEELEEERKRASSDPLTKLANRNALFDALTKLSAESAEQQTPLSILMLDIDHFKKVNDTHGHLIGDRVIRYVANVLNKNTKGMDVAARYGGEEFAVLLPNTGTEGARALAEKIRITVAEAKLVSSDDKRPLGKITISIGVAQLQKGEDPMEMVNRADQALYASKNGGRNKVTISGQISGVKQA